MFAISYPDAVSDPTKYRQINRIARPFDPVSCAGGFNRAACAQVADWTHNPVSQVQFLSACISGQK